MSETALHEKWAAPQEVDDLTVAFPAHVVGTLLPPWKEIPDEFHDWGNPWQKLAAAWFSRGLARPLAFKGHIDGAAAMRHLRACLGSFQPKHEHKMAGVAYLLSLWCADSAKRIPR
jgi:hypothetical protein